MLPELLRAIDVALTGDRKREFILGAIAQRKDGAWVHARNERARRPSPRGHAESRLSRKLTPGCVVFVARITPGGTYAMAKPCKHCLNRLRHVGVKRVVFTTDSGWSQIDL